MGIFTGEDNDTGVSFINTYKCPLSERRSLLSLIWLSVILSKLCDYVCHFTKIMWLYLSHISNFIASYLCNFYCRNMRMPPAIKHIFKIRNFWYLSIVFLPSSCREFIYSLSASHSIKHLCISMHFVLCQISWAVGANTKLWSTLVSQHR